MNSEERIAKALAVSTDTRAFEMGRGNLAKAPEMFRRFFEGRKALVVVDNNTWRVAGKAVYDAFVQAGLPVERFLFDEEEFHADWDHIERLDKALD